jgi:hypothetical protein
MPPTHEILLRDCCALLTVKIETSPPVRQPSLHGAPTVQLSDKLASRSGHVVYRKDL